RIGRIFGINIRINWSWLLILALIVWNLTSVFGQAHPEWSPLLRGGVALVAALLFFASVLAHELAHSLMARAQGLPVRNITLFLFGGVSNIQREPPSPRAEFLITIVGPATSIVLGLFFIFGGIVWAGQRGVALTQVAGDDPTAVLRQLGPVVTVLFWLGPINLLLGVFNLIPGFPLDGGRILRSALWALTDNLRRATRWASWVGQGVAWLLIIAGISMIFGANLPVFGSGVLGGVWLAFIGWFLNSAAIQSYRQVVVQDLLEDVPVSRVMRPQPPTVAADSSVDTLVNAIMGGDERAFPVIADGQLVGLVTLEDVRRVPRAAWPATRVREIMTPTAELVTLDVNEDAAEALHKLQTRDVRQVPVLQNGRVSGLLRRRDIMKWLQLQGEMA
ncbi:MAG: site-2 protease family protein, partial [Anaerolineales bacterium]|nr:site-2 protease family protein [Anaerolineales bacterium]